MEETSSFLKSLLASHGPNYLEKLFGPKARNNLHNLGGVDKVAIARSESQTIEDLDESCDCRGLMLSTLGVFSWQWRTETLAC